MKTNTSPRRVQATGFGQPRRTQGWRNPIAAIYLSIALSLMPLVALSLALSPPDTELAKWANGTLPIYLIGVLGLGAYRIARAVPAAMWSPAFWLLVSSAVFFGFGPLVEVYGNYETRARLSTQDIAITEVELFSANLLSFISIFCLASGFWLHTQFRPRAWRTALMHSRVRPGLVFKPETVAIAFIVGGMVMVHVFIMPSQWGQLDIVVPGALSSISPIVDVGFALAAYLAIRGTKKMWWILALLWPLHLFLTLLSFAKAALLIALILPALGAYLGHRRMIWLAVAALVIVVIYPYSQDFVNYGRAEILKKTKTIWRADHSERIRITLQYLSEDHRDELAARVEDQQDWAWMRLNYSNVQAISMRFRDAGVFMDTLSNAWTLFIPRALWPDKPIYIGPGVAFYTMLTGNEGSSAGNSVIGDVYWQFGWIGTLVIMPLIGWMFAMTAWRSIEAVVQENFIRMPLVLLSILTATSGQTNFLVNGIIAVIPIYVCYVLLVNGFEWFVRTRKQTRRAPPAHPGGLR